jgi:hypothetical protein
LTCNESHSFTGIGLKLIMNCTCVCVGGGAVLGIACFHCVIPFIHYSMESGLKSDVTIFLQYKLATISPHAASLIHVYSQYIAFKILSFRGYALDRTTHHILWLSIIRKVRREFRTNFTSRRKYRLLYFLELDPCPHTTCWGRYSQVHSPVSFLGISDSWSVNTAKKHTE